MLLLLLADFMVSEQVLGDVLVEAVSLILLLTFLLTSLLKCFILFETALDGVKDEYDDEIPDLENTPGLE